MNWFFWAFLAMICWGLGPIFAKLGLAKSDPFSALLARTLGVLITLGIWGAITSSLTSVKSLDARTWTLLIAEGIAASVIGHFAYFKALQAGKVSLVVPIVSSYPLVAVILSILLLSEKITLTRGIGMGLIILGVLLIRFF